MTPEVSGERLVIWSNPFGVIHCGKSGWTAMVVRVAGRRAALDAAQESGTLEHHLTQNEWRRIHAYKKALPVRRRIAS